MSEATIASFILRFTQEYASGTETAYGAWRGVIRHVQTQEEMRFTGKAGKARSVPVLDRAFPLSETTNTPG
jgi:hypothetical protein